MTVKNTMQQRCLVGRCFDTLRGWFVEGLRSSKSEKCMSQSREQLAKRFNDSPGDCSWLHMKHELYEAGIQHRADLATQSHKVR